MNNYHPLIEKLEKTKLDLVFSDEAKEYFVVPTDFLIANHADYSLWQDCPDLVNFDLVEMIRDLEKKGTVYNATLGELFCQSNALGAYQEHSFLSAMIYCSQRYRRAIREEERGVNLHEELTAEGFVRATTELLEQVEGTNKRFYVQVQGMNIIGVDINVVKRQKMRLLKDAEKQLFWMAPNATRRGYRAQIGQYIKQV